MDTTRAHSIHRRWIMVTGAARRMGSKATSQQPGTLVAPTDAAAGPQRQYCWLPEAISGGSQSSKYSLRTVTVAMGDQEMLVEPTIPDAARAVIDAINAG